MFVLGFFCFINVMNSLSSLHIFICLNSSSSAPSPHTPWMLNLSSYYLFPISLSLSLPSIHLSSALERSLSLFLSKSIFSAVRGLEPYWKHFQCCWLDSSCQAEAETSCRNVDHRPDLRGLPSLPLPPLARLERSNFGNINNAVRWWLSKTSIQAGVTRGAAGKEPGKSRSSSVAGNRSTSLAVQFAQRGWQLP